MNTETLSKIRIVVFGLAGLVCASYSVLALMGNTPRPFSPWLPGASGFAAGLVMWLSAISAGPRVAGMAHDELFWVEWGQAVKFSYWLSIALYPLFGIFMALGWIEPSTSIAAMGTAAGAAPMLAYCILNLRS
jgi:hypothetical protein